MVFRVVAASLVLVAATATARAQAPGDYPGEPVGYAIAPPGEAVVIVPAPPPRESVMANRWAVGLGLGHLSLAPQGSPDQKSEFGVGELSLRFRATLHLELELAFGGGRDQLPDGQQGDREVHAGGLALRYRFCPEHKWNWWLMGGLGALSVVQHVATDQAQHDAQRPMTQFGVGLERRFHRFALQVELRAIGAGPQKSDSSSTTMPPPPQAGQPAPNNTVSTPTPTPMPVSTPTSSSDRLSGGQVTLGASYYF